MDYCSINGVSFDVDVAISDYEESFNVLDGENSGRVMTGRMIRDVIGTYLGHKIAFFNNGNDAAFNALWDYLVAHSVDGSVMLSAADGQDSIAYEAYYTSGTRRLKGVHGGKNRWDELEVSFVPMDAQVKP